jgi:hypothetical protein
MIGIMALKPYEIGSSPDATNGNRLLGTSSQNFFIQQGALIALGCAVSTLEIGTGTRLNVQTEERQLIPLGATGKS